MPANVQPTPIQIYAEFDAQPPLVRQEAVQRYIGLEVDWPGTLADAREQKPGWVHVVCWPEPDDKRLIVCDVPLSEYPQLKQLRVGDPLQLRGRIHKIDVLSIQLDIQELVFAKAAGK